MSAIWPSAIATTLQMLLAINNTKVLLDVNAGIGDTTLTVDDASPLSTSGYLTFNDNEANPETISYTGKTGNNLTGVTRGADGTAASVHTADGTTALEMRWNASYHNTLATEVIAIEQNLSDRLGVDSGTHVLKIVAGLVGAPALEFAADTNTGIYSVSADVLGIATGGVLAVTVNASQQLTVPKTSNQIILGTTNTVTVSASAPASSRVWTMPDLLTDPTFAALQGTQTFSGAKTFSGAVTITTNDLTLTAAGKGIVVTTPDGTHTYRLAIDNDGQFTTEQVS